MRKIILLIGILISFGLESQTTCESAMPFCTGGLSGLTFPATVNSPPAQPGPFYDCLFTQPNPAWYYLQVANSGNLIILIEGQIGGGPGQDVDFCCWGPFNTLSGICNSLTAGNVVDCSYSANYTETCTIPNGITGQYYMVLITNFANVPQNIVFTQIGGTGSTNCALLTNNSSICAGNSATIIANNPSLTNPSYSVNPGALTSPNPTFVVSPTVTTQYTVYVTGTNNQNAVVTVTAVSNVTVNPNPLVAPTTTQATCATPSNSVNLNLVFNPPAPVPNYTVTWNPIPPGPPTPTQTSATGLGPGVTSVTVTAAGGCSTTASFTMAVIPGPSTFTISPPGGTYSVTCTNTLITINTAPNNLNYSWISISNPSLSGNTATFNSTNTGTYTVTGTNPNGGCSTSQTIVIGQNTITPTNSVNPTSQAITCNSGSPVTFSGTVISPTVNIQHDWYSPLSPLPGGPPIATSNNTISILSGAIAPGIYTLVTTNLVNGCTAQKTITITSLSAWPTFNVLSPTNFSIGCSPLNCTTLTINNPVSTQTPQATCSYTFLAPSFTGAVTPSVVLGGNTSTSICTPGTWTVIVQDNSNWCRTSLSIPIIQNTVAPNVSASMFTQTLTCKNPTVIGTGTSTTSDTQINWGVPSNPPLLSTSTLVIGPPTGPNTSTTSLTYATYTVIANNTVNACSSTSIVTINQNFRPPVSSPTISIGTATAIYCTVANNPAVLTTGASTVTSGEPFAFVANPCWAGPSPQNTICGASTYSCFIAGVYSLTVEDSYNGCLKTGTINVIDRTQPPVITNPLSTATLDCGASQASMQLVLTGTTIGGVRYLVKQYPQGAAFTPSSAIIYDLDPILSGTTSSLIAVSKAGTYIYSVTNTLTGCRANGTVVVVPGDLTADFEANPVAGYAPLNVNFTNNSSSSLGSGSITSVWSFGNGSSQTNSTTIAASVSYTAPGSYTVMLLASKGACLDTSFKIIKVDIPSKLEVPNVFTPNGDGSNDIFFLKVANITQVLAVILDRWGNKVYEVLSNTGNIAWDGKNFAGKECASGVYFYIIKGEGKDDKKYEMKGNVSLFR